MATMGNDLIILNFKLYDLLLKIKLIDNPGQERYRPIVEKLYKNANSIILIYNITRKKSFEECKSYFKEKIKENCERNVKIILIGNKNDLEEEREVTPEEGYEFAVENNFLFMETSCLNNENIYEAFEKIIVEADTPKIIETIKNTKNKDKKECQIF